jgi:chemotaxis protein methyltransferase CheR
MKYKVPSANLQQVCEFLTHATGLDFPAARQVDLQRGIVEAAKELGFNNPDEYLARLLNARSAAKELESLINHLTVGETYFFREKRTFEILAEHILPAVIRARRNGERRLRIWSAACCTGEEPYSIAIVLRRMIPDWEDWNITLLATDINSRFLRKAISGECGKWSFRDAPPWLCGGYFQTTDDKHFKILPEIMRIVKFARLNLAEDGYPSVENDTNAMDVIFCRNVLMYFTAAQAHKVIRRLYRAQADGGWLIVGAGELSNVSCVPYVTAKCDGAIIYQKGGEAPLADSSELETAASAPITAVESWPEHLVDEPPECPSDPSPQTSTPGQLAVSLANQGKLSAALEHCDQWIAIDRLNASSHCLRGVILQEQGNIDEALRSLRTAMYLDPNCARAHFVMGSIARSHGDWREATRHLSNTRKLLHRFQSDDPLPEFDGVTAGRFLQIIDSLIEMDAAA